MISLLYKGLTLRNTFKRIQTPNTSRVITSMLLDTPLRHLCISQDPNKTTRKQQMQKDIPTSPKVPFENVWQCLLTPVGVSWCLWVSVGVCLCLLVFCVVKICLEDAWRGYQRISECFLWMFVEFRCVWGTIECSALVMKEMALCWDCSEMQVFFSSIWYF